MCISGSRLSFGLLASHPALLVDDLPALVARLEAAEAEVTPDPLEGYFRVYVDDPFGNRLELLEPDDGR